MFGLRRGDVVDVAFDLVAFAYARAEIAVDRLLAPWRPVRVRVSFDDRSADLTAAYLRNLNAAIAEAQRLQDRKTEAAIRADARAAGIAAPHVDFALHLYATCVRERGEAMIVEPLAFFRSLRPDRGYLFGEKAEEPTAEPTAEPVGHVPGTA